SANGLTGLLSVSVAYATPTPFAHAGPHTDGCPVQLNPGSTVHDGEQPSAATRLPSSHPSPGATTPSPQLGVGPGVAVTVGVAVWATTGLGTSVATTA